MRIGLFGGRFDPPHLGHLLLAEQAREALVLDRVWFLPAGDPPHKPAVAAGHHRAEMTRLATADHPDFDVDEMELDRSGPSYTIDTVTALSAAHPESTFLYLVGADAYAEIATWHRAEELVARVPMVVLPRPGTDLSGLASPFREAARSLQAIPFGVSSTLVRRRVAEGHSLRYLVPPAVVRYLRRHALYGRATAAGQAGRGSAGRRSTGRGSETP